MADPPNFLTGLFRFPAPVDALVSDTTSPNALFGDDQEARYVRLIGPITAPRTHFMPAIDGADYIVENTCAFAVTLKTPSGVGVILEASGLALIRCKGIDYAVVGVAAGLTTTTKTITTLDIVLTPAESVADRIVLSGAPVASHSVTMDGAATRPAGTLLRCLNATGQIQQLVDGNGTNWLIYPGEIVVFEWSDSLTPTLFIVARSTIGGATFPEGLPAAGQIVKAISPSTTIWQGPNPTVKVTGAGGTTAITDADQTIFVITAVAGQTLTLPNIAAIATSDGRRIIVKAGAGAGAHNVVIDGNGANIDAAATYTIAADWGGVELVYVRGTGWIIAAKF